MKNSHTVIVLKDITEVAAITPSTNKNITVDLNGYNVNTDITVPATTKMTFKDSSENSTGTYNGTITNKGTLAIESGNYTKAPVTEDGATTILNGGTYPIEDMENVTIPEDKEIVANEDGTYSIVSKVKDEENNNENTGVVEPEKDVQSDVEANPKTSDGIIMFVVLAVVALAGIVVAIVRLKKKHA